MSKKKITAAADQSEKILRVMARFKRPMTATDIASALDVPRVSAIKNRITAMRDHGLIVDSGNVIVGKNRIQTYAMAGELKALLAKNRKDAEARIKHHYVMVKGKTAEKIISDRDALQGKVFDKEDYPAGIAGEQLSGGGYVEKTPTGRVFRLEAFRRPARDCIGDKPRGACGVSSLGCEYVISFPSR